MEASATRPPGAIQPLSPADFGIGGLTTPPILPTPPLPLDTPPPPIEAVLDATDLLTLRAMRGLLAQAWADFAGAADPAARRETGTALIHAISCLTGFLDGQGIGAAAAPGDGFGMLFGQSPPPTPEAAMQQLLAILSGLVDVTPTRRPNPRKAQLNAEGDALITLGTTVIGAALAALLAPSP